MNIKFKLWNLNIHDMSMQVVVTNVPSGTGMSIVQMFYVCEDGVYMNFLYYPLNFAVIL